MTEVYIDYDKTEQLLNRFPRLKALLENLQTELELIFYSPNAADLKEEEVLYAIYFARELTDMPRSTSGSNGDKILNTILSKDRIMQVEYPQSLIESIKIIGGVVKKISTALSILKPEERRLIELRDWQDAEWKIIEEEFNQERKWLGQRRREAIERMIPLIRVTPEQHEYCLEKVR